MRYDPRHMNTTEAGRAPRTFGGLKSATAAAAVTAALLPALLATPALAADQIGIDGNTYNGGTAASGTGWSWGGGEADPLNLNNYNGGAISWQGGDLTINATGNNTVGSEDFTMTDSRPQGNNGQGETYTYTETESIHESTADGGTFTTTYPHLDTNADPSVQDYSDEKVVVTDAKGNVVDPKGSLTITGGGTITTKAGVTAPGAITVNGGTTLSSDRGITAGGYDFTKNSGNVTVSDNSTLSSGGMINASGDVTVSGGSVLQTTFGYESLPDVEVLAALSSGRNVTVTDSSADLSLSGHVNVGGKLSITRSDFRCSDYLTATSIALNGSELKSGSMESYSGVQSISGDSDNYAVIISPVKTAAEKAAPSTATATKGVLAVRQTPVAADNAPAESANDAVHETFIVSSVGEETASGTFALGFSVGSGYAGRAAKVYVQHEDGTNDVLDATVGGDGLVRVTTTKLSRYTVVVKGEKAANTTNTTTGDTPTKPASATTTANTVSPKVAPAKHAAAAHLSASRSDGLPQTGDPLGAVPAVLAALGLAAVYEAKHLRREA